MSKSILDVMHETAKGLTEVGVMNVQTLRELGMLQEFDMADYLTTTEDIKFYLEAWGEDEGDNLELLQLMLEDSVKAVIKLRQSEIVDEYLSLTESTKEDLIHKNIDPHFDLNDLSVLKEVSIGYSNKT